MITSRITDDPPTPTELPSKPKPLLAVLQYETALSPKQIVGLQDWWKGTFEGNPPFPLAVIHGGAKLSVVTRFGDALQMSMQQKIEHLYHNERMTIAAVARTVGLSPPSVRKRIPKHFLRPSPMARKGLAKCKK